MSDSVKSHVLVFFSPKCKFCQNLLTTIQYTDLTLKLINIHELKDRPKFLKQVPTILASGSTTIFEGKMAFQFVENQKQFRQSTFNREVSKSIKLKKNSDLLKINKNSKINPYSDKSMGTQLDQPSLLEFDDRKP